jgi:hypothetical protein
VPLVLREVPDPLALKVLLVLQVQLVQQVQLVSLVSPVLRDHQVRPVLKAHLDLLVLPVSKD